MPAIYTRNILNSVAQRAVGGVSLTYIQNQLSIHGQIDPAFGIPLRGIAFNGDLWFIEQTTCRPFKYNLTTGVTTYMGDNQAATLLDLNSSDVVEFEGEIWLASASRMYRKDATYGNWVAAFVCAGIKSLCVYNGELYFTVGSTLCKVNSAKTGYTSIGSIAIAADLNSMAVYKGNLYIISNSSSSGRLHRYDGTTISILGSYSLTSTSNPGKCFIYSFGENLVAVFSNGTSGSITVYFSDATGTLISIAGAYGGSGLAFAEQINTDFIKICGYVNTGVISVGDNNGDVSAPTSTYITAGFTSGRSVFNIGNNVYIIREESGVYTVRQLLGSLLPINIIKTSNGIAYNSVTDLGNVLEIGTGTEALSIDNYKMDIPAGLTKGSVETFFDYDAEGKPYRELRRSFTNNSGASLTIREAGLFYGNYLTSREVYTTPFTLAVGQTVTIKYITKMTID